MKPAAIFGVLVVACFFESGNAARTGGTDALKKLMASVISIKDDLECYGKNMVFNLNSKLSDEKNTQLANINQIVNPLINDIQSSIAAAKDNGKDAEHCFEPAGTALKQATVDADTELDKCKNDSLLTISPVKSKIDAKVRTGFGILAQLDAVPENCMEYMIPFTHQLCITLQVRGINGTVQSYESSIVELKTTGDSLSSSALTTALSCNQTPVEKVRQTATDVRILSNSCINSV